MAKTKVDNKLNVVIGKKSQITGDTAIPENAILIVTDENEQALNVEYNNTTSGLEADNVQDAIDETIELLNNVDLSDYYSKDETFSQTQVNQLLDAKADKTELFSGSYNDLTDKPTVYTKTEIDAMIGDIETLLGGI